MKTCFLIGVCKSPLARMAVPNIIYYLCIRNKNSVIMETREYF